MIMNTESASSVPLPADMAGQPLWAPYAGVAGAEWTAARDEGQLSVDVLETPDSVWVVAPLAGTRPEAVSIHLANDVLTIRGERSLPVPTGASVFYQECFWGKFSRTIVLPVEVRQESVEARYQNGVLVIRLLKFTHERTIPLLVIEE